MARRIELVGWELGWTKDPDVDPEEWVPARVPGNAQTDWARTKGMPPFWIGENYREYSWMEDVHWVYRIAVPSEAAAAAAPWELVLEGVDYEHHVVVSGHRTPLHEGMFRPHVVSLPAAPEGEFRVVVSPPPKKGGDRGLPPRPVSWLKPGMNYGWDFAPRLIPTGIWRPAYLRSREWPLLDRVDLKVELGEDLSRADLVLSWPLEGQTDPGALLGARVEWTVQDPSGAVVLQKEGPWDAANLVAVLDSPKLWWPHDQGDQPLYVSQVRLRGTDGTVWDAQRQCFGVRRVRLVPHPEGWIDRNPLPKGPQDPPMTLEVNGRAVFVKGSNWVPPEIYMGECSVERFAELLQMAKSAHMNLLRVWGGGIINPPEFFDLCDELGLMVWQEFPMACAKYESEPRFLKVLEADARHQVRSLKHHPSLVLWCGGNELYNSWSRMTEQDLPLRALNSICYQLDPSRPFLMTSPIMGVGHGDYRLRNQDGLEVHGMFQSRACTAYCEFGVSGPPSVESLRRILPEAELWPPRAGTSWEVHHAFRSWDGDPDSWLMWSTICEYLGEPEGLEDLVEKGQWLQALGLKEIYEEARRQKPRCSMALNWCFNEPWPSAANNSIVAWPAEPKPAYHAVRESLRPVLASARVPKIRWTSDETFSAQLWVLNDRPEPSPAIELQAWLESGEARIPLGEWSAGPAGPNENSAGPTVSADLKQIPPGRFWLAVEWIGQPDLGSRYGFLAR